MGQGISDVFYPDNPNRRNRAEQLREDILAYLNAYDEVKKARDELLKEIGPRLATLLKNEGYDTPEALDAKVQSILKGDHLAQYLRVKAEHDAYSEMERTVFAISSYISIGSGVFLGGLALLGIITGGTAFAILGGVGLVLAAVAAVFVLFAVIEGERERSNLREVIYKLGPERVKARRAQMLMQAISNWCRYIKQYLDSAVVKKNPDLAAEIWEGDFKADFAKSEHRPVVDWLVHHDRERGAWTNEDGNWMYQYSAMSFSALAKMGTSSGDGLISTASNNLGTPIIATVSDTLTTPKSEEKPKVILHHLTDPEIFMVILEATKESCIAQDDKGDKWAFMPETVSQKNVNIDLSVHNSLFSLTKLATGEVLHNFSVVAFTPSP